MKVARRKAPDDVLTFVCRSTYQAVFVHMLSGHFETLYYQGFVLKCGNGVVRRIYPRVFAYSADYLEK